MKTSRTFLIMLIGCFVFSACAPSKEFIETQTAVANTQVAASWTITPTSTNTPLPTNTATPTLTPTPTPIPFTKLDFSTILLQESDLPRGFRFRGNINGAAEMSNVFREMEDVQNGLIDGSMNVFSVDKPAKDITLETEDYQEIYNGVYVYESENYAKDSLQTLRFYDKGAVEFEIPQIGDQSVGLKAEQTSANFAISMSIDYYSEVLVIWRYQEAVFFFMYHSKNPPKNDELQNLSSVVKLAHAIQRRTIASQSPN